MILAGYSPCGSQMGVSSSLAAIAAWRYFETKCSVLIVQVGYQNNLEDTLLGMETWKKKEFFETKGMDELLRATAADYLNENMIKRAVISLNRQEEGFALLSATTKKNPDLYQQKLKQYLPSMLEKFDKIYDLIYLDFGWEQDRVLQEIEMMVDMIYLFLPQNRWILEKYNQAEFFTEKEKIILPKYHKDSIWNLSNLKWRYPKIGKKIIGVVPWEVQYMDAWSKGKGFDYLAIQCDWKQKEKNFLMDSVGKLCQKTEKEVPLENRREQKAI